MIGELGHLALILAFLVASIQAVVPLLGAWRRVPAWMAVAVSAARAQFLLMGISYLCFTQVFVVSDFSFSYVAQNSNTALPLIYKISAVWGAHEGSMLLWGTVLAGWGFAVATFSTSLPDVFRARVLAVIALVSVGFQLFLLLTSNPFERLLPAPLEGRDLNPLLQDPGMAGHPPLLYMGYVGLVVPFSFAVAALIEGRIDLAWTRWTRPWTTVAWAFLTGGIMLGSWWAYSELGWGGWWFWDPVENASFMPWLVATALIHSLAVTEQRGAFRAWTLLLAISAFSLSLLGAFLVRSGVLVSVHAFATDPARGLFILAFLTLVIGAALALYAWRAARVAGGGDFHVCSRETFLLANNVLLVATSATVLLGTLYPLLLDALGCGQDLRRTTLLQLGLRAADASPGRAARIRAARPVEARRMAATVDEGQDTVPRRRARIRCAGVRHAGDMGDGGRHRICAVDRLGRGAGTGGPSPAPAGRIRTARARARLRGNEPCPSRRRCVHRRGHLDDRRGCRARRAARSRREHRALGLLVPIRRRGPAPRPELPRGARYGARAA